MDEVIKVKELVIYENGEVRKVEQPVKIYTCGEVVIVEVVQ